MNLLHVDYLSFLRFPQPPRLPTCIFDFADASYFLFLWQGGAIAVVFVLRYDCLAFLFGYFLFGFGLDLLLLVVALDAVEVVH